MLYVNNIYLSYQSNTIFENNLKKKYLAPIFKLILIIYNAFNFTLFVTMFREFEKEKSKYYTSVSKLFNQQ